jgi:hypothetical protein
MIDWMLPIAGIMILFLTPKGLNREINEILACLLIFIFGYEQYIIENSLYDSEWHDVARFSVYGLCTYLFYKVGGYRQYKLSLLGAVMCLIYGGFGFYYDHLGYYFDPRDYLWAEAFIALSIIQLYIASDGAGFSTLCKRFRRYCGRNNSDSGSNTSHRRNG